jgi:hypothetical protein
MYDAGIIFEEVELLEKEYTVSLFARIQHSMHNLQHDITGNGSQDASHHVSGPAASVWRGQSKCYS